MNPPARDRATLITRAKRAAVPVANCVAARVCPGHVLAGMTWDELAALVVVLADAVDHRVLADVIAGRDDGRDNQFRERDRVRKAASRANAAEAAERARNERIAARAAELRAEKQAQRAAREAA
jgi:hypothetical protein